MAYTDLLNEGIDDLAATLATISGLPVVTDPRNLLPGCAYIDAPSFDAFNYNIVNMDFPVKIIGSGPGNSDALRFCLSIVAKLLAKNVAVLSGNPGVAIVGGTEQPCYNLTIRMQAQTG